MSPQQLPQTPPKKTRLAGASLVVIFPDGTERQEFDGTTPSPPQGGVTLTFKKKKTVSSFSETNYPIPVTLRGGGIHFGHSTKKNVRNSVCLKKNTKFSSSKIQVQKPLSAILAPPTVVPEQKLLALQGGGGQVRQTFPLHPCLSAEKDLETFEA